MTRYLRVQRTIKVLLLSASRGERASQSRERAHTSMTMNKSTDSSDINTALSSSDVHVLDFGMLYEKFKRPVHSYIYRLLGSHEDADDLTQEVFTRAYVAWNDLDDRDNLSSWLYRIATNLCIDQLRRRKRISWWPLVRRNHAGEQLNGDEEISYLPGYWRYPRDCRAGTYSACSGQYTVRLCDCACIKRGSGCALPGNRKNRRHFTNAAATRISRAKRLFAEQYQRLVKTKLQRGAREMNSTHLPPLPKEGSMVPRFALLCVYTWLFLMT